jgi:AraC-like DNA-binding protein
MLRTTVDSILHLTSTATTQPKETLVPGLYVIGGEVPVHQLAALYRPMIGFVIRGEKRMQIGEHTVTVRAPSYFLLPMHLPVTATVHSAGDGSPYRSVGLDIDQEIIQGLLRDVGETRSEPMPKFAACPIDVDMADGLLRLLRASGDGQDVAGLAPAFKREIFFRVLKGPQGGHLRELALREGSMSKIAVVVERIRQNFNASVDVEKTAREAGMAVSTFHRQFKQATGLSPIQFQKQLRLLEARNLIAYEGLAVSNAAYSVGYESASQFTREYSRFFGTSPSRHGLEIRAIERERSLL